MEPLSSQACALPLEVGLTLAVCCQFALDDVDQLPGLNISRIARLFAVLGEAINGESHNVIAYRMPLVNGAYLVDLAHSLDASEQIST